MSKCKRHITYNLWITDSSSPLQIQQHNKNKQTIMMQAYRWFIIGIFILLTLLLLEVR